MRVICGQKSSLSVFWAEKEERAKKKERICQGENRIFDSVRGSGDNLPKREERKNRAAGHDRKKGGFFQRGKNKEARKMRMERKET